MEYDAITIDTSTFDGHGLNLEGGMLNQLTQFKHGHVCFVLSEIVVREVYKHLIDKAEVAKDSFTRAIKEVSKQKVASGDIAKKISKITESLPLAQDTAKNRLEFFIAETGAEIITADTIEIENLVTHYFKSLPPFDETGKKKYEFPDAIALMSLEKWAEENQQKILAVSKDKGWRKFAAASEWIDIEDDLAAALDKLQQQVKGASEFVDRFLTELDSGDKPELMENITSFINDVVTDSSYFYVEASAAFEYEVGDLELELKDISFMKNQDNYQSNLVQSGNDLIISSIALSVSVIAFCDFTFVVRDSIDKDYIYIGDCRSTTEADLNVEILVTLEGDFSNPVNNFKITEIELVDLTDTIDFGYVEVDYDSSEYEFI